MESMAGAIPLPAVRLPYLVQIASELGMYEQTWRDLSAWLTTTGTTLPAWEAKAVIEICAEYTVGVLSYNGKDCPSPWVDPEKIDRKAIADQVRRALG